MTSLPLILRVIAMMALVTPHRQSHDAVGVAIATAALEGESLYRDDADRSKTASVLVAEAFRESRFVARATGDCPGLPAGSPLCTLEKEPTAFGAFQVALPHGAKTLEGARGIDVLDDVFLQARVALRMTLESFRAAHACGGAFLGLYASGPHHCGESRAKWISDDRLAIAKRVWLATEATP